MDGVVDMEIVMRVAGVIRLPKQKKKRSTSSSIRVLSLSLSRESKNVVTLESAPLYKSTLTSYNENISLLAPYSNFPLVS